MTTRSYVLLVALVAVLGCSSRERAGTFHPLVVGERAPSYAVRTLAGDTVRVGAGAPLLINVWATWCESCREEMADLAALEREYASTGLRVLAVSVDAGDGERVRRFVASEHLPLMIAHDPAGEIQRAFQAVGVPETYLVSADGRLLWVRRGGLHGAAAAVRTELANAVADLKH